MNDLSSEEVGKAVTAYLQHPNRVTNGALEDQLIKVIEWVSLIKEQTRLNIEILNGLLEGKIVLDVDADGNVIMSNAS